MFVISEKNWKTPIKVWLDSIEQIEESCLEQAKHLAQLPFIHKWVCLMPDTHTGMGMPIGGVIAADGVVVPNAVGVDIGCGMNFVSTNIKTETLKNTMTGNGSLLQVVIGDLLRNIPVGFQRHKVKQESMILDQAMEQQEIYQEQMELFPLIEQAYFQVGTLGGGNHFVELQEDDEGYLGIMIHSGSRRFGKEVCDYYHQKARALNEVWYSQVPDEFRLAFLPISSEEGKEYIRWMQLALDFAFENRERMMDKTKEIVEHWLAKYTDQKITYNTGVNCHHNYASLENHYDKDVWVHRKGATRVQNGELAVIPGAMGSYSYVVMGTGNKESFCTSSHGAGRAYSRKGAMAAFSRETVMKDLKDQGVVLGKHNKTDVAEESRFAYKDIDRVMNNQKDLVIPVKRLKTIGVVKG